MRPNKEQQEREGWAPLHEIVWALGKQLITGTPKATPPKQDFTSDTLDTRVRMGTVQQVAISLRMNGIVEEDDMMLSSLESMALAGEITFDDFIGRIQNLFPKVFNDLDVTLRMKVAALILPNVD